MIFTIFNNYSTNEEIIILEGNNDKDLTCGIKQWEKDHVEHKHYEDDNYRADWDDTILRVWDINGTLFGKYQLLDNLENGKNIYKKI